MPPNQQMETKAAIKPCFSLVSAPNVPWIVEMFHGLACYTHTHTHIKLKTAPLRICVTISWWFDSNGLWGLSYFTSHTCMLGMTWPGLICPEGSFENAQVNWLDSMTNLVFHGPVQAAITWGQLWPPQRALSRGLLPVTLQRPETCWTSEPDLYGK